MHALGLDIGTTKLSLVSVTPESGEVTTIASAPTPALPPMPDAPWAHLQDAAGILALAEDMLGRVDLHDVCAIGVTGQMHGIVYLDERGQSISPLYTWEDERGGEASPTGLSYAAEYGIPAGYGHVTHLYNRDHGLVPARAAGYCTIADALTARLCASAQPTVHASNAASLGGYLLRENDFSDKLPLTYPYRVVLDYALAGTYRKIPVAVAIGDNQASFFGSGCAGEDILINIGTGSQVSRLVEHVTEGDGVECRPATEGKFLQVGAALCGGRAYAMLNRFFCDVVAMAGFPRPTELYGQMTALVGEGEDARLRFENTFCGTRAMPWRRGSIRGLGEDNFTPRDFCIGILEGMVNELAELYGAMGCYTDRLVGAGNALRKNPVLCKMCEKRFGAHLILPRYTEEAACGAALYALIATGTLKNMSAARDMLRGHNI